MNILDTRDLAEKREELQTDLVNSFNDYFDTELEDFGDLTSYIDNSEDEDVQEWKEDNSDDFDHIEEINYLEGELTDFIYGETLIPNDDFTDYCEDMVNDRYNLKDVPDFIKNNINWEGVASDLEVDYSSVTYQGVSYLVRA